jgi:L-aspartate oxidase
VFGRRCAEHINNKSGADTIDFYFEAPIKENKKIDYQTYCSKIRNLMTKNCGIIRNATEMKIALEEITKYYDMLSGSVLNTQKEVETLNMTTVAIQIITGALNREESVGAHFRNDASKN